MSRLDLLREMFKERRYRLLAMGAFVSYVALYLYVTRFVLLGGEHPAFGLELVPNWTEHLFRQRGTFLYEPIGSLYVTPWVELFISVPNFLLAAALSFLVALNVTVSYYVFRKAGWKGTKGVSSLLATVPALLGGAACCVPTLILVIGLQFTAFLSAVWSFLIPLSFLLLVASLWWALAQAGRHPGICRTPKKRV